MSISSDVCLICFEPKSDESHHQMSRVCETCTEAVVCQECLEQYRKHWNQQCCICKRGEGVVKIHVLQPREEENSPSQELPQVNKRMGWIVTLLCIIVPIPLLWLWLKCDAFAKPIDEVDAIFRAVFFWFVILPLVYFVFIYHLRQFVWAFRIKTWLLVGNCLYVLISFLFGTYGTFIGYYMTITVSPILLGVPPALIYIITRAIVHRSSRVPSRIQPIQAV